MKAGRKYSIVAIASSTGGPGVLRSILPGIAEAGLPVLVTQHINQDFAAQFAVWLEAETKVRVKFAEEEEKPVPGTVLLAPPDLHLAINSSGRVHLLDQPRLNFQKPSADHMFFSAANYYRNRCIGIILTGMGRDGADGILRVRDRGGYTIAQDKESCVVFGMPREAVKNNGAMEVLHYRDIPARVIALASEDL
jgi:two-component system chemotaxis response regulator CheB